MLRPSSILRAPQHPASSIMVKNLTVFGAGLMGELDFVRGVVG